MRIIVLLLTVISFYSCKQEVKQTVLSPEEKIKVLPYGDLIATPTTYDTISELNSFTELNNLWLIGTQNGIYIMDKISKKVIRYFKFELKSHKELFDGQDSTVRFLTTDLIPNKTKDKLLVVTSNGIVFQIDLKKYNIDWLVKFVHRIETATYSDNGKVIAIGTGYDNKEASNGIPSEYYSSLFTISSDSSKYIDHFNETASVKKILFKDNDTKLLVAYDWNYTDSYLWDINNKEKNIAQFAEEDAYLYDIALIDNKHFVTVNTNGLSLWDTETPDKKNLVFSKSNSGFENILRSKLTEDYFLVSYSKLFFFDKQFNIKDTIKLPILFEGSDYSANDSLIILKNLMNNNDPHASKKDDGKEGFYTFNLATKELNFLVGKHELNEIIKANWH